MTVRASYSKRRREDVLGLDPETARALARLLAERRSLPSAPAFSMPQGKRSWRSAAMLREDLEESGIPYRDEEGRVLDFHGLRHTFISDLAAAGVEPKVAQALARHSSITLTLDRYTHLRPGSERDGLAKLTARRAAAHGEHAPMRATGTAGAMRAPELPSVASSVAFPSSSPVPSSLSSTPRTPSRSAGTALDGVDEGT